MNDAWERYKNFQRTIQHGHRYHPVENLYTAKERSHDDGKDTGLFLGGIGAPVCSRSLDGQFSRWHMQTGHHVSQPLDEAFIRIRWHAGGRNNSMRLDQAEADRRKIERNVYSLFPVMHESYSGADIPVEVALEAFSPLLPQDNHADPGAAILPVWYVSVAVKNTGDVPADFDTAFFFPNMLGWKTQRMTSTERPVKSWPGQTHAGNTAAVFSPAESDLLDAKDLSDISDRVFCSRGVLQQRFPDRPVTSDMEGQAAILPFTDETGFAHSSRFSHSSHPSAGKTRRRSSAEACFKVKQNLVEKAPENQKYTLAWLEQYFAEQGSLPETGLSWEAHWDEALGSAVSQGQLLQPGESAAFDFCMVFDLPIISFGSGRKWYRKYTETFGSSGKNARKIAVHAASIKEACRNEIDRWQKQVLESNARLPLSVKAAMLNELYFINGGGTAWVSGCMDQSREGLGDPLLGNGEHGGLLEGYDIGYYYYNTSDLWPYAWFAVSRWWPDFSECIFSDYAKTIPMEIPQEHMIYRSETMAPGLVKGKIPHDMGSVMEDPWNKINGYQMRDDSNLWKDHNPGFIISLYLHRMLTHRMLTGDATVQEWEQVREAGMFMLSQAESSTGLPRHDAFGDSTWDNLGIRGTAAFSGGLTLAALAALQVWAEKRGDSELQEICGDRLETGQKAFLKALWNGSYYRLSDSGKYAECIMSDGILGFYLADLAGLFDRMTYISRESLRDHLRAVYTYTFRQYENGKVGPLLVAAKDQVKFSGDGGDELQVNEVLTGSAWMTSAMMYHFSLKEEGDAVSQAIERTIYQDSGMQFRTPAAYDAYGKFRAPMNMRPLSVWFLDEAFLQNLGEKGKSEKGKE